MKLMASRVERDEDDLRLLIGLCGIRSAGEALELLERTYGAHPIEPRVEYLLAELLGEGS